MKEIYLNILGLKNFETEDLTILRDEIELLRPTYSSILWEPVGELKRKIQTELRRRETSRQVWVEFVSYWSGYTSKQRKIVGKFYRKIDRELAEKMPKYFSHNFSDNTKNDWYINIVHVKGKNEGSYSTQIDEFLNKIISN